MTKLIDFTLDLQLFADGAAGTGAAVMQVQTPERKVQRA